VSGYLAYWDELIRRHPNMLIDSCASGGQRNDLETLRRSVPLLRSDYILEPVGNQGHTYGIALWVPFFGTGGNVADPYVLRSVMMPGSNTCFDVRRKDLNYDVIRREVGLWRQYAPNFFGDYYPLTTYNLDSASWIGWQFDRSEEGEGMIQMFRRAESPYESARVKLRGLDADAVYAFTNVDMPGTTEISGREVMEKGIQIPIEKRPGAAVILYKKK
jgi:alpha-galactosidase